MPLLRSASDIPDSSGRTAIITGANSGIGFAAATALAAKGAHVILASRDLTRGRDAAESIGDRAEARRLDLASLASVREFAAGIEGPVDYLINNAGAMAPSRRTTADGFELQFGVNHLGHFALTNLLLDRITTRVVTVTSSVHRSAAMPFADLQWEHRPYRPFGAYGQSKLANMLFTVQLQRLLVGAGSPVLAEAADPGYASTGFRMTSGNALTDRLLAIVTPIVGSTPAVGVLPTLLATTGSVAGGSLSAPSRFGVRGPATVAKASPTSADPDLGRRLWEVSEQLTDTRFPLTTGVAPTPPPR